jgi:NodT family efflux transporter outer membrane factor (OMF) lipoprotein
MGKMHGGRAKAAGAALCILNLGGCAVGPDFAEVQSPTGAGYSPRPIVRTESASSPGGAVQHMAAGADVSGAWWKLFHSRQIDAFVAESLRNHPDLAAAQSALRQAREAVAADTAGFFPSANANSSLTREQASAASTGISAPASLYTLYNVSAPVSFTPDIFGARARAVEADEANAEYERYELEATVLSLSANVVTAAINDASLAAQIQVTQDLIRSQREQVQLLENRFALGAVSEADVLSQKAQLATTLATLPPLEKSRAIGRDQLLIYLGRFPNQDHGEAVALDSLTLPRYLPVSLPSALVRQRPDIEAAESQWRQASANVGVATANMLPQLTLSASYGSAALTPATLFNAQTAAWSLASNVASPVFDAGALFHTKQERVAALDQARSRYQSTVLSAFQNVADSLQSLKADAALLNAEGYAEKVSANSLAITQSQFNAGASNTINVLNAEQTLLNARTGRVKAQAARFADTVALFQSLGGGWWNRVDTNSNSLPAPITPETLFPPLAALSPSHVNPNR